MVGNRLVLALSMLAAAGCSSTENSPAVGASGGSAPSAAAGQGGSGGRAGGNANSGSSNGGAANSGSSNGGAASARAGSGGIAGSGPGGSGGGTGTGGKANGTGGGGAGAAGFPACIGDDDASAPFLDFVRTADPAPAAMGGTIASGTYFLTGLTYHGGTQFKPDCLLSQVHEVLRVTAASSTAGLLLSTQRNQFSDGSGKLEYVQGYSYTVQGSSLLMDYTCWEPYEYSQAYSATSNQILFLRGPFDSPCDNGVTLVLRYDKQP